MPTYQKNTSTLLDYKIGWTSFLYSAGTAIDSAASAAWFVPTGITAIQSALSTTTATIWLSAGLPGETFTITNQIWTTSGRSQLTAFTIGIS